MATGKEEYVGKRLESPPAKDGRRAEKKEKNGFWYNYGHLLVTAAVFVLVFRVVLQLAYVPSSSMETTIPKDSLLLSWQLPFLLSDPEPQHGDIVTFWNGEMNKLLVKRVIGLAGDEIWISGGYVYVNGEKISEPYLNGQGITNSFAQDVYTVPEGHIFLLGDNRTGSQDSRRWEQPYIAVENIRAQVKVCIPVWYWNKIPLPILREVHLVG